MTLSEIKLRAKTSLYLVQLKLNFKKKARCIYTIKTAFKNNSLDTTV